MAERYRSKMFEVYEQNVNEQTDKKILELEKRYNLTEAENKTLKFKMKIRILSILSVTLLLLIAFILLGYYEYKKVSRLKNDKLQAEKLLTESKAILLQRQTEEQKNMIRIYSTFLAQYSEQLQSLKDFEMKFKGKHNDKQKLAEDYLELLKEGNEQFSQLLTRLFPSKMFDDFFHFSAEVLEFLTESDKLLLIMLALEMDNTQIAALLNIPYNNQKSRKAYIKRKIIENASKINNFEYVISLF